MQDNKEKGHSLQSAQKAFIKVPKKLQDMLQKINAPKDKNGSQKSLSGQQRNNKSRA